MYGKQRGSSETRFSEHRVFAHWYPDESDYARPNPFCNNANCAVRRELWCQAPYNEELPGLEDVDWAKRVTALGHRVTYEADAEIVHVHDETARQVYRRYFREGVGLARIFPTQRMNLAQFVGLLTKSVYGDLAAAARGRRLLPELRGVAVFRFMQYWGAYRGLRATDEVLQDLWQQLYYPGSVRRSAPEPSRRAAAIQYD